MTGEGVIGALGGEARATGADEGDAIQPSNLGIVAVIDAMPGGAADVERPGLAATVAIVAFLNPCLRQQGRASQSPGGRVLVMQLPVGVSVGANVVGSGLGLSIAPVGAGEAGAGAVIVG